MPDLSRNAQLLKYFAQQQSGMSRKRLVKLAYMADIVGRQFLGRPLSSFDWVAYHYGPYSLAIPDAIQELEDQELCWTKVERVPGEATWKKLYDSGKPTILDFSLGEDQVLHFVVSTYLDMSNEELIHDVVYETTPFTKAERFGEALDMGLVDGEGKDDIGFDLELIAKAERQAEEGDFVTAREYFDGLRNRIAARHTKRN